jgi:Type II secretion system (T2SS), protein G
MRFGSVARRAVPLAAVAVALAGAATLQPWIAAAHEERDVLCVSRVYRARGDLRTLTIALENGRTQTSRWPASLPELVPNYIRRLSLDPWGRAYLYKQDREGKTPKVSTLGADGERGGTGENTDLSSDSPLESIVEEIHEDRCRA